MRSGPPCDAQEATQVHMINETIMGWENDLEFQTGQHAYFLVGQDGSSVQVSEEGEVLEEHNAYKTGQIDITDPDTGRIKPPKTLFQAMKRPDAKEWSSAFKKEVESLANLMVLSEHHTLADIRKLGITTDIVPMRMLFDVKYHPNGSVDK